MTIRSNRSSIDGIDSAPRSQSTTRDRGSRPSATFVAMTSRMPAEVSASTDGPTRSPSASVTRAVPAPYSNTRAERSAPVALSTASATRRARATLASSSQVAARSSKLAGPWSS